MSRDERDCWDKRHSHSDSPGEPEPFLIEMLPLMPRGLALDVAAGRGRNSIALARTGMRVVAVDHSEAGLRILAAASRAGRLPVCAVVADVTSFPIGVERYNAIVNVNFLERELFPAFKNGLKIGGMLLVATFLIDQAELGHPRNPRYLLQHHELRDLLSGLELLHYREGMVEYESGTKAWRASALAARRI